MKPRKTKYVLVVTHGRTGSTLLKDLLNTADGCLIRGENNNFFYHLWMANRAISDAQNFAPTWSGAHGPWNGIENYSSTDLIDLARKLAHKFLLGHDVEHADGMTLGFKEIRYFGDNDGFMMEPEMLSPYFDFLSQLFEPVTFVHLTRDLNQVAKSAWFRQPKWQPRLALLSQFNENVARILQGKYRYTRIDYSQITSAQSSDLVNLFRMLGLTYDVNAIETCLNVTHGTKTGTSQLLSPDTKQGDEGRGAANALSDVKKPLSGAT